MTAWILLKAIKRYGKHTTGIAMFSDDPAVYIGWSDIQFFADQKMKPSSVQIGSTSDHTFTRKTADFPSHVRQNVNCVIKDFSESKSA